MTREGAVPSATCAWDVIVAIPVKNEVEHIVACLAALDAQTAMSGERLQPYGVLLYVNNSDDGTAALARSLAPRLRFSLTVMTAELPPHQASAGGARRRAMDEAADMLEASPGHGARALLMTTDADSRVPPDWIARAVHLVESGVDAVAGTVALDAADEAALPDTLKRRGALEARYEALVCEIETRLDSTAPHDPWPRHPVESGASFAVTLASFRAVGGVPDRALGEDRALADALRRDGFSIRHAPDVVVVTAGRLVGRAVGGCADTMRLRIEEPDTVCDPYLRPALDVLRAARNRPCSSRLLAPTELPRQIAIARMLLVALRGIAVLRHILRWRTVARFVPRSPAIEGGLVKVDTAIETGAQA